MSRSNDVDPNSRPGGVAPIAVDFVADMYAYDTLPPEVRRALTVFPIDSSAGNLLEQILSCGMSPEQASPLVIEEIERASKLIYAEPLYDLWSSAIPLPTKTPKPKRKPGRKVRRNHRISRRRHWLT